MSIKRVENEVPSLAPPARPARLIESDAFPFEFLSSIAERESWRKEVYRPVYHIHKWWATRLGSVFRGIILGCVLPEDRDLREAFYERHNLAGVSVFDPFMGSGTTVGEAHKLGCTAIGRDINSVACESVRVALGPLDTRSLAEDFEHLSGTVGERIQQLYRAEDESGSVRDVLYFFWIKQVSCPDCSHAVDLFPSRVFARNAFPSRKPEVQVCCPFCGGISPARNTDRQVACRSCRRPFNPLEGTALGTKAVCPGCSGKFAIADAVRRKESPPLHRLYAKLLLFPDGTKQYLPATADDERRYAACTAMLRSESDRGAIRLPVAALRDGHNTRQAIGYNYRRWRDFFNDRQLLALSWLQQGIANLSEGPTRDALFALFSGVLEFNNLFASYKGEGTGAVRHMFSHHILKPERMPIEANVWGTAKSSGAFRTLFSSRLLRACKYRESPFEVTTQGDGKAFSANEPFSGEVVVSPTPGSPLKSRAIYLSCGSSDQTGLPDRSVDLVVTDPPFFDNVHYSELADFFHAWQELYPRGFVSAAASTRNSREVQDSDANRFADKLQGVLQECRRVLKDGGLLAFTYHHSRSDGWLSLAKAVYGAEFSIVQAHPVKAEMSVAAPKSQAKEPIQLDVVFVCRKREEDVRTPTTPSAALLSAEALTLNKLRRLRTCGLSLSRNDCRVVLLSQFLTLLGPVGSPKPVVDALSSSGEQLDAIAEAAFAAAGEMPAGGKAQQRTLFALSD